MASLDPAAAHPHITFIAENGEHFHVKPAKATIAAAWKLGMIPLTGEDRERAEAVERASE